MDLDFPYPGPGAPPDAHLIAASSRKRRRSRGENDPHPNQMDEDMSPSEESSDPEDRSERDHDGPAATRRLDHRERTPHRASEGNLKPITPKEIRKELAGLGTSLNLPLRYGPDRHAPTMKQRNVSILMAIIHRCIHEEDWVRAGRAFDGLYGIGAEILLQGGTPATAREYEGGQEGTEFSRPLFSKAGFEAARTYYESLAAASAHRNPQTASSEGIDFELIMLGLWIAKVQDFQDRTRARSRRAASENASRDSSEAYTSESTGMATIEDVKREEQLATENALDQAQQIEQKINGIINSRILNVESLVALRSNVETWIEDLQKQLQVFK